MRLSKVGEIVCVVLLFVSAFWHEGADRRSERQAAMALGLLAIGGWFASSKLKGWVGRSYRDLEREMVRVKALAESGLRPDGTPIPFDERQALYTRFEKLLDAMKDHPENPRSL